jgi:hypothetical protein
MVERGLARCWKPGSYRHHPGRERFWPLRLGPIRLGIPDRTLQHPTPAPCPHASACRPQQKPSRHRPELVLQTFQPLPSQYRKTLTTPGRVWATTTAKHPTLGSCPTGNHVRGLAGLTRRFTGLSEGLLAESGLRYSVNGLGGLGLSYCVR